LYASFRSSGGFLDLNFKSEGLDGSLVQSLLSLELINHVVEHSTVSVFLLVLRTRSIRGLGSIRGLLRSIAVLLRGLVGLGSGLVSGLVSGLGGLVGLRIGLVGGLGGLVSGLIGGSSSGLCGVAIVTLLGEVESGRLVREGSLAGAVGG